MFTRNATSIESIISPIFIGSLSGVWGMAQVWLIDDGHNRRTMFSLKFLSTEQIDLRLICFAVPKTAVRGKKSFQFMNICVPSFTMVALSTDVTQIHNSREDDLTFMCRLKRTRKECLPPIARSSNSVNKSYLSIDESLLDPFVLGRSFDWHQVHASLTAEVSSA